MERAEIKDLARVTRKSGGFSTDFNKKFYREKKDF